MGIYSQIKEQIGARDVAEHYGMRVGRNGMMICPFHEDTTPSMKVDKYYYCFGCHDKGDVIRFASKLFDMTPYETALKLVEDMNLKMTSESRPAARPEAQQNASRKHMEEQRFTQAVDRAYNVFCSYLHLLNRWAAEHAPRSPTEALHPLYVEAMQKRESVEHLLDLLLNGSNEEKARVLIDSAKEVVSLEQRIRAIKTCNRNCAAFCDDDPSAGNDNGRCDGSP